MINIQTKYEAFSVSFVLVNRTFGPKGSRQCVECDLYAVDQDTLVFINRGIAICNPADQFDARIGAHKALHSALTPLNLTKEARQDLHRQVEAWPWPSR